MAPRPYQVALYVGATVPVLDDVRVVDLTPAAASVDAVLAALREAKLAPSDMRARVVLVVDPAPVYRDAAVLVYAALVGFTQRRLDVLVGDEDGGSLADLDSRLRHLPDSGRPDPVPAVAQVGEVARDDLVAVGLSGGLAPAEVAAIRYARRVRWVASASTVKALQELVLVAALRARGAHERFPALVVGDEPVEEPGAPAPGHDLDAARKGAESLRRDLRSDNRDAVTDPVEVPAREQRWVAADAVPVAQTLTRLGARSKFIEVPARVHPQTQEMQPATTVEVWHCPRPQRHANGDATPSMRIHAKTGAVQCFRCDLERVGSLRLVMDVLGCSADEAADFLLADQHG